MPICTIRPVGDGLYHIHVLDPVDPGFGGGRPGGPDPGYDRPSGGRPDNSLPGYGRPDQGLPGGGHISNRPPGSWEGRPDQGLPSNPNFPNNSLPSGPPPHLPAGTTLILVRSGATGTWHYAAIQPGQPVPPPLPGQGLPGTPPPTAGQPLPPTPAPKPV